MTSAFRFGNGSSKTNSEKLGVVNDNSFWTGDGDGMAQKYTDPDPMFDEGLYEKENFPIFLPFCHQ